MTVSRPVKHEEKRLEHGHDLYLTFDLEFVASLARELCCHPATSPQVAPICLLSSLSRTFSALRVQYNNAFRGLLGLPWRCSASGMFADSGTDGFHAVLRKRVASLWARVQGSPNTLLKVVAEKMDSPMITHWMSMHQNYG
ncbi:uncharacterized protein LOC133518595 [Cydia pomonella]|uniref:uncharacterized protein LOC133518595 n=1 Tax=Cydia pomonella TaxID=82600 RepID=UPI002ADDB061|nr:uncharacterized protein LOC133518595 [Cydia pomonella]